MRSLLRRLRLTGLGTAAGLLAACGGPPPEVPVPTDLATFDGELQEAIQNAVTGVLEEHEDAATWLRLGMTYEAHSMHDYALRCYRSAVERAPEDARAWYRLAVAATNDGDAELVAEAYGRMSELAPEYTPARRRHGRWLLELGQFDAARAEFEAALGSDPEDHSSALGLVQVLLEEDRPREVIDALEDPRFARGGHAALAHRVRGLAMVRLGLEGAVDELRRGEGARPGGGDPWSREVAELKVGESAVLLRAGRMIDRGQAAVAVQLLEELVTRSADDPRVHRRLAKAYASLQRWEDSARSLLRTAELEPDDPDLFLGIAAARQQLGDAKGAIEALEGAVAIEPGHAEAAVTLIALLVGSGQVDRALSVADSARAGGLDDAALEIEAGWALLEAERFDEAGSVFLRASVLDETQAEAWIGLAIVHATQGDTEAGQVALGRARGLVAEHPAYAEITKALEAETGDDR